MAKTNVHPLIISSSVYFFLKMKVRMRMPKVPTTSKKEEVEMARVRMAPDCSTDYRAKLMEKYMKNRKSQTYMRKKVAFLTDP